MLNIANIINESIVDGDGLRLVIFEQGCSHNCKGCHNPETHSFKENKLYSVSDLIDIIKTNPLLDGVTLSGGDPFFQAKENIELIKEIKKLGLDVWAYTGFVWEDFMNYMKDKSQPSNTNIKITDAMIEMLSLCDVIVEGKFIEALKTLDKNFVGSSNQRLIDIKKSLDSNNIILYEIGV